MQDAVKDAIRFYYEQSNDDVYLGRCRQSLDVTAVISTILDEFDAEVDFESNPFWPSYQAQLSFGEYAQDMFVAEFRTTLLVSKLARLFHVFHAFSVKNNHELRVAPSLRGFAGTGYIIPQFNMHEVLRERLTALGYIELDLADMEEIIPTLSFPEGVTIFGRQVSVQVALFDDLRGLCPAD